MNHVPAQLAEGDDQTWISLDRASSILNLQERTVRRLIASKKIRSSGQGGSLRVLLGDVRRYDSTRNKSASEGGRKRWIVDKKTKPAVISPSQPTSKMESSPSEASLDEVYRAAQRELTMITERITTLSVRKAELEEVIVAFESIRRFLKLDGLSPDEVS